MGKSIIISSTVTEFIKQQLLKIKQNLNITDSNGVDLLEIYSDNARSISIEKTRILKTWSINKPYFADNKLAIIHEAHLLTDEAQNSMLKILEEPNNSITIVLTTFKHDLLLPTVISRCELIQYYQQQEDKLAEISINPGIDSISDFIYLQKILAVKDKKVQLSAINNYLVSLLVYYRKNLFHGNQQRKTIANLKLISETKRMLDQNVSARLALENLTINLER